MTRIVFRMSLMTAALLLSACGAATASPTAAVMPVPTPTSAPTATQAQAPTQASAAQTSLDPCQLISSQEASSLAGVSFGAGTEGTTQGGAKTCTYGANTANVFMVIVGQAKDAASAQAYKTEFLADLQAKLQQLTSQGLKVTELPNFADGAVLATLSISEQGVSINGSSMGVLKGTVFFGFSDIVVGGAAPTSDAMQSEATAVLGRLP